MSDVKLNLTFCLDGCAPFAGKKKSEIAEILSFNASTISRACNASSKHKPSRKLLASVSRILNCEPSVFGFPHSEFVIAIQSRASGIEVDFRKLRPHLSFGSTEKWKHLWRSVAKKYQGSYFLYTKVLSSPKSYAVSLLRISRLTSEGLEFDLQNVDNREVTSGGPIIYRYDGLVFPISDVLYFFGEEASLDEMISLVCSTSQVDPPSNLKGYFLAVGVGPGLRIPSGSSVVLIFQSRKMLDAKVALKKLGVFSDSALPSRIVELLP